MGIVIALSGHICRSKRGGMMPFWAGFMNIQRALPRNIEINKIVGHSWSIDQASVVEEVYGKGNFVFEKQPDFNSFIENLDKFEEGLNRSKSTWANVSVQSLLGNALGRSRVVSQIDQRDQSEACLLTRWDIGNSGTSDVNTIIVDPCFDLNFVYCPYFKEVDEGYADMWFFGSKKQITKLADFFEVCVDSLNQTNDYITKFCTDWPYSYNQNGLQKKIQRFCYNLLQKPIFQSSQLHGEKNKYLRTLLLLIKQQLLKFERQAELWNGLSKPYSLPIFQSLNIHALLKYYCLERGLRDYFRFVRLDDFELKETSGCVINPVKFVKKRGSIVTADILEPTLTLVGDREICQILVHTLFKYMKIKKIYNLMVVSEKQIAGEKKVALDFPGLFLFENSVSSVGCIGHLSLPCQCKDDQNHDIGFYILGVNGV